MTAARYRTFVALGDSYTEGLDDPYPDGTAYRGWADRVAAALAATDPEFRYANLAIRGKRLDQIVAEQVPDALRLAPDLVSLAGGGNDLLRGTDPEWLGTLLREVVRRLRANGSQVLLFVAADASRLPGGRRLTPRIGALNDGVRRIAAEFDTLLAVPQRADTFTDPSLWSRDRLHLNAAGHQLVADGVLTLLGADPAGAGGGPDRPLQRAAPFQALSWPAARVDDLRWARDYGLPWLGRRLRGRSSGDGRSPKRPDLGQIEPGGWRSS